MRPFATVSSAPYVWFPISKIATPTVIIVGVGAGGIGLLLEPICSRIIGFEQRSIVITAREHFTQYQPTMLAKSSKYSTHPASWTTSGRIQDPKTVDAILATAQAEEDTLVIIDVEGVGIQERLTLFNKLTSEGVQVAVKLFLPGRVGELEKSLCSTSLGDRHWWRSPCRLNDELILVGRSPVILPLNSPFVGAVNHIAQVEYLPMLESANQLLSPMSLSSLQFFLFDLVGKSPEEHLGGETELFNRFCYSAVMEKQGARQRRKVARLLLVLLRAVKGEVVPEGEESRYVVRTVYRCAANIIREGGV